MTRIYLWGARVCAGCKHWPPGLQQPGPAPGMKDEGQSVPASGALAEAGRTQIRTLGLKRATVFL